MLRSLGATQDKEGTEDSENPIIFNHRFHRFAQI